MLPALVLPPNLRASPTRQLEDENLRLRKIVTDLTLDVDALKNVLSKNFSGPHIGKTR